LQPFEANSVQAVATIRRERKMDVGATLFVVLVVFSWLNVGGVIHF
jgi:hypothetical protein